MAAPEATAPAMPCTEASSASLVRSMNLGNATADRMPRMMMTTINSINVKPFCNLFIDISIVMIRKWIQVLIELEAPLSSKHATAMHRGRPKTGIRTSALGAKGTIAVETSIERKAIDRGGTDRCLLVDHRAIRMTRIG